MKIRQIKEREIDVASKIVGLNYSKEYEKRSKREIEAMFRDYAVKPKYLVAEHNGKIVGFAGYIQSWIDYHIYQIFWVNVLPKYQKKGIGTALVRKIIQIIKIKHGEDKAYLILLTTSLPKFYERLGFETLLKLKRNNHLMILKIPRFKNL